VLPDDAHAPEVEALLAALSELRGLVAGAALEVSDEHGLIGWDDAAGGYGLGAPLSPAPRRPRSARAAPAPEAALPAEIAAASAAAIAAQLTALVDGDKRAQRAALAALAGPDHDANAVARLALRALARTKKPGRLADAALDALARLAGVNGLVPQAELDERIRALPVERTAGARADLGALWSHKEPRGHAWSADVDRLTRLFLDDERIVAQLLAAVARPRRKRDEGRIESALIHLGSMGTPAALRAIVRCLREDRGRPPDDDGTLRALASLGVGGGDDARARAERAPWREVALHQLERMKTPLALPTLSLELAEEQHGLGSLALAALVHIFGERPDYKRRLTAEERAPLDAQERALLEDTTS
jgi:hypothetical protein